MAMMMMSLYDVVLVVMEFRTAGCCCMQLLQSLKKKCRELIIDHVP
jgi:hypothetical protein